MYKIHTNLLKFTIIFLNTQSLFLHLSVQLSMNCISFFKLINYNIIVLYVPIQINKLQHNFMYPVLLLYKLNTVIR